MKTSGYLQLIFRNERDKMKGGDHRFLIFLDYPSFLRVSCPDGPVEMPAVPND